MWIFRYGRRVATGRYQQQGAHKGAERLHPSRVALPRDAGRVSQDPIGTLAHHVCSHFIFSPGKLPGIPRQGHFGPWIHQDIRRNCPERVAPPTNSRRANAPTPATGNGWDSDRRRAARRTNKTPGRLRFELDPRVRRKSRKPNRFDSFHYRGSKSRSADRRTNSAILGGLDGAMLVLVHEADGRDEGERK